jgi:hypothetical protein
MDFVMIMAVLRHIMTFAGGVLISLGWIDEQTMTQLVGALTTAIGLIWSVVDKKINQAG